MDSSSSSEHAGDTCAHFRIVDEIARGGMGVVLKGHDAEMGRDVAIKMLLEQLGDDPLVVQRFIEEAQISGQLQHPGIVPVYEFGKTADGRPFFAMKLVKGDTLAKELSPRPATGARLRQLLSIFESVAQTMAYAHSRHVIHRDLKPSNVMVGAFGEVLLVDWGLAKVLSSKPTPRGEAVESGASVSIISTVRSDPDTRSDRSTTGSVLGTLAYMSPEQARGEVEELDERTDVFSLGAILCEILTGHPPYSREYERVLERARGGDLSTAWAALEESGTDAELAALVRGCLEPARTDRLPDAGAVAERISAWLASSETRTQEARVEAAAARETGERRARWLTIGLAASVLFAVLVIAGFWTSRQRERSERLQRTEEVVAQHLNVASFARGRGDWNEARVAIAQARTQLESGDSSEEHAARIEVEELALERDVQAAQQRLELVARRERFAREVEVMRTRVTRTNRAKLESYARLMEDFGVDMAAPTAEVEQALRESDLTLEMTGVLVDWARLQRIVDPGEVPRVSRLLELALAVDDDPRRSALRRAILDEDRDEVLRIAREQVGSQLPPMTAIVLADELWSMGEADEAMLVLDQAELQHPDDFHVHAKLAVRYMNLGDTDGAFVHLKAALVQAPQNPWLLASLSIMYTRLGDVPRAVALCRQAVNADPQDSYARHYLGVALAEQGDLESAVASYRKAIELEPEYAFAIRRLAYALTDLGQHAESLQLIQRAADLEPENPSVLNSLAWRLATIEDETLRDHERALEVAERVMDLAPDDPDFVSTYGVCLYYNGHLEDSIVENERAQRLSGGVDRDPAEIFFLAMAHARLGNLEQADAWLERGDQLVRPSEAPSAEMLRLREEAREVLDSN